MTNLSAECSGCRFFEPPRHGSRGECRRHAPVPSPDNGGPPPRPSWPLVDPGDWCGEYQGGPR